MKAQQKVVQDERVGGRDVPAGDAGYTHEFDAEQPYCVAIAEAVADATGTDPAELPEVLYEVVDGDALERLFEDSKEGGRDVRVTFSFCNRLVTLLPNRTVVVQEELYS